MTIFSGYCEHCGRYTASWIHGSKVVTIWDKKKKVNRRILLCSKCARKKKYN